MHVSSEPKSRLLSVVYYQHCSQFCNLGVWFVTHSKLHTWYTMPIFHDSLLPPSKPTRIVAPLTTTHCFRVCLAW